jgi:hypothetical protein
LRSSRGNVSVLVAVSILTTACGLFHSRQAGDAGSANTAHSIATFEHHWDGKPNLSIVERSGDPVAALAFAARTRSPPIAIVTLATVLQNRLSARSGHSEVFPNSYGLTLVILVSTPEEAELAAKNLDASLSLPINAIQLDDKTLEQARTIYSSGVSPSDADVDLAQCTGELLADSRQLDILSNKLKLLEAVERARTEIHHQSSARFAFVGTRAIALGVERALGQMQPWLHGEPPRVSVEAAPRNSVRISISKGNWRRLSIAWRVGSVAKAVQAALALRSPGSPLQSQVVALNPDWKVDSISAIARDFGACLRIDLSLSSDTGAISPANLETIARVTISESRAALDSPSVSALEAAEYVADSDPRLAARRVAWNSVSTPERSTRLPLHVSLGISRADTLSTNLEPVLREAVSAKDSRPLDAKLRLEVGQSEQWVLLASPCGTSMESAEDAGSTSAWIRAIAGRYSGHLGVQVEPWLTPDGVGFIAHCHPQSQAETPETSAARLGNALGSVIATGSVSGAELAAIREDSLLRVGSTPRSAWWLLVDSLSANHPALFEPLGSFESIRRLDAAALRASRLKWLHGPLRLGTLLNRGGQQLAPLASSLHRWLDPHRTVSTQCPQVVDEAAPSKEIQLGTRSLDAHDSNIYLAVHLASETQGSPIYEHWLLWLLSRPGGWLQSTTAQSGSLNSFTADVKGPRRSRSLIIGISVVDESQTGDCILRLRALLSRLAEVGADANDVQLARTWSEDQIRRAELDPRRRLVDLWWGSSVPQKTQISGFSRYLHESFTSAAVTVLRVRRLP